MSNKLAILADGPIKNILEQRLTEGWMATSIAEELTSKYKFKVSPEAVRRYKKAFMSNVEAVKKREEELRALETQQNAAQAQELQMLEIEAQGATLRAQEAISRQIDLALADLYTQIINVKASGLKVPSRVKDIYNTVERFLEFKAQHLQDLNMIKERNYIAKQFVDAFVDLLKQATLDNEIKKSLGQLFWEKTRLFIDVDKLGGRSG